MKVKQETCKCPWETDGRDDAEYIRTYCTYRNRVVCFGKISCDEYNAWLEGNEVESYE